MSHRKAVLTTVTTQAISLHALLGKLDVEGEDGKLVAAVDGTKASLLILIDALIEAEDREEDRG
jgi:hypothetical protein